MTKLEKIAKLKEVSTTLKEEFVGLEGIIDEIISSISPWYVTPEIIERPVIVSLWGMTGTGKSSVVRRLTQLLDLKDRSLFVDCGEITGDGGYFKLTDRLSEFLFGDNDAEMVNEIRDQEKKRNIFVLDEFQYARTLDQQGCEIEKAAIRPIWQLIDSGKLDYNEWEYGMAHFKQFAYELADIAKRYPDARLDRCVLSDKKVLKDYINELGFFFYDRNPVDIVPEDRPNDLIPWKSTPTKEKDEEEEIKDPYAPLNILALRGSNPIGIIYRAMNRKAVGEGTKMLEAISAATTLGEFYQLISEVCKFMNSPKVIDCSQSLIFIIGNLDEAFQVEENTSPDLDADIFNDITSKVTISDIKNALKKRFRAEQIARLGNNLIKYPTLRKNDFKEIIRRETTKIFDRFEKETGIRIVAEGNIIDLLYSEGVFPTQGVRPVFTTIITLLTPILSEIILWSGEAGSKTAVLKTKSEYPSELEFRVPKISIIISTPEDKEKKIEKEVELNLQLGALRFPGNRTRRFSSSVHEVGHAIISSWFKGIIPVNIVGVDTDGGGFCDTYDKEKDRELQTVSDIREDIMISMAGYCAERLVFGDRTAPGGLDRVTMGASSDISRAWSTFVGAVYYTGMFGFTKWGAVEVSPRSSDAIPEGFQPTPELEEKMKKLWNDLEDEVDRILTDEKELLKQGSLRLAELGSLSQNEFKELIENYGKYLTLEKMEKTRKNEKWFEERLRKF